MKNYLYLTIGLPQSGKSTWARMQRVPIVNRDSIRYAIGGSIRYFEEEARVSEIEELMVTALFKSGSRVIIVDATHLKSKYRKKWEELGEIQGFKVKYKRFKTPLQTCLKRARRNFPNDVNFPKVICDMWKGSDIDFTIKYKPTIFRRLFGWMI